MTEDEIAAMFIAPQVQIGNHTLDVHVSRDDDGCRVELRHPDVGGRTYRVLNQSIVHDEQGVVDWIALVAPTAARRLDAEGRFRMKQAGYA